MAGTAVPFRYNQIEQLEAVVAEHGDSLGAIVVEPFRHDEPQDGFLEKMREVATKNNIVLIFDKITSGWREFSEKHGLKLHVVGWPAVSHFSLEYVEQNQALQTLFTQEMLDRGYLAKTAFYVTYAHIPEIVEKYLSTVDEVFGILADAIKADDINERLRGPVAHTGFSRLT